MVSVSAATTATSSSLNTTHNHSTDNVTGAVLPYVHTFQLDEIIIILILVCIWFVAVLAFIRKWDSIRIMQPMEQRYRQAPPKNLESIKIVKRPQDSIIYKNYGRKVSVTMVAREKRRLQRMHTMPCMNTDPVLEEVPYIGGEVIVPYTHPEEDSTAC